MNIVGSYKAVNLAEGGAELDWLGTYTDINPVLREQLSTRQHCGFSQRMTISFSQFHFMTDHYQFSIFTKSGRRKPHLLYEL